MRVEEIHATVESAYRYEDRAPDQSGGLDAEEYRPPTLRELRARRRESAASIAEGLLARGDILLMFAPSGVGKSTYAENMAAYARSVGRQFAILIQATVTGTGTTTIHKTKFSSAEAELTLLVVDAAA